MDIDDIIKQLRNSQNITFCANRAHTILVSLANKALTDKECLIEARPGICFGISNLFNLKALSKKSGLTELHEELEYLVAFFIFITKNESINEIEQYDHTLQKLLHLILTIQCEHPFLKKEVIYDKRLIEFQEILGFSKNRIQHNRTMPITSKESLRRIIDKTGSIIIEGRCSFEVAHAVQLARINKEKYSFMDPNNGLIWGDFDTVFKELQALNCPWFVAHEYVINEIIPNLNIINDTNNYSKTLLFIEAEERKIYINKLNK